MLVLGNGEGARSLWVGHSFDLDWSHRYPRSEFEAWVNGLPRDSPAKLPPALQGLLAESASLEETEVAGLLEIIYFKDGAPWIVNRFDFTALVRSGGLHVREHSLMHDEDAEVSLLREDLIYDGRMLLIESSLGTVGQAYLPGYFDLPAVLRARIAPYGLLQTWLEDPVSLQRLVGTRYESLSDGKGNPIVVETYPGMAGPGTDGSTVYRFGGRDSFPRISSVEYRAGDGAPRIQREFLGWSEISDGNLRPSHVVEKRFDERGELQRMTTLEVRSAQAMSLEQARAHGWLTPRSGEWLIFQ